MSELPIGRRHALPVAGAGLVLLGLALGRLSAPTSAPELPPLPAPRLAAGEVPAPAPEPVAAAPAPQHEPEEDEGGATDGVAVLPWVHGHEEDPELVALDPAAITAALERFRASSDPLELDDLIGLLGQTRDVRVETAALDMAQADRSALRRRAAFDLLDMLDRPAALPVVLRALAQEDDPGVRCSALFALPRPEGARGEVIDEVGVRLRDVLSTDPLPEARRRAALALGDWWQAAAALPALVQALAADPSPEVRAGAAFALEQARSNAPVVRAALLRALTDRGEDPLVRDNAWHALGASAPLSSSEEAAWLAFGAKRGQQGLTGY